MKIIEEIGSRIGGVVTRLYQLIDTHVKDVDNPHRVTKAQVGLGSADNTADRDKPLSEAQRVAVDNLNKVISDHASDGPIHRTSGEIRADIVDGDIPDSIARKAELGAYLPLAGGMMTGDVNMGVSKIVLGAYSMHENAGTLFLGGNGSSFVLHCAGDLLRSTDGERGYPIWDAANDGHGSGLDADLLDGKHGEEYALQWEMEAGDKLISDALASETERARAAEAGKVDKEAGKGLSSNDFTDAEKVRLAEVGTVTDGLKQGADRLDAGGTPSATWHIGQGAGVVAKNSGGILEVRNAADSAYADVVVNGLTVKGNVAVEGDSFVVNAQTVETADNLILLNRGEVGAGVTKGVAGLEIDRGTQDNYKIIFDESDDRFKAGVGADLWPILLRDKETDLGDGRILVWDTATKRAKAGTHAPDSFALKADVPTSLKNPYPLTFSGSASGVYDGSSAFTVNVPSGLLLGETSATAYRGDRGKIAYDYSQGKRSKADLDGALQTEINNKVNTGDPRLSDARPANGGNADTLGNIGADGYLRQKLGDIVDFNATGNIGIYDVNPSSNNDPEIDSYGCFAALSGANGQMYFSTSHLEGGTPRLQFRNGFNEARFSNWAPIANLSDIPASLPASDVSAWAKAASKPVYDFSEINSFSFGRIDVNSPRRMLLFNSLTISGFVSNIGIGTKRAEIGNWGRGLFSVGTNDAGTTFTDFEFDINGRIYSPAGTFALTSEIPTELPANGGTSSEVYGDKNTDYYGMKLNSTSDNDSEVEIYSGDDNTPIVVRQYRIDGPNKTASIINTWGNTVFPGDVYANGGGDANRLARINELPAIFNSSTAPTSGMKKGDIWVKP